MSDPVNTFTRFCIAVYDELLALRKLDIPVSVNAVNASISREMIQYQHMSVKDCADLLRELYP